MKFLNKTLTKNINIPFIAIPVIVLSSLALIASDNITKANAAAGRAPSPNKPIPPAVKPKTKKTVPPPPVKPKTFAKQPSNIQSGDKSEQPGTSGVQAKIKSLQEQASAKPKETKPAPTRGIRELVKQINEDNPENKTDNTTTSSPMKTNESPFSESTSPKSAPKKEATNEETTPVSDKDSTTDDSDNRRTPTPPPPVELFYSDVRTLHKENDGAYKSRTGSTRVVVQRDNRGRMQSHTTEKTPRPTTPVLEEPLYVNEPYAKKDESSRPTTPTQTEEPLYVNEPYAKKH